MLRRKTVPATLLYFRRQVTHGFRRNDSSRPGAEGGFRFIDGQENFGASAFALFPEGKSFLHRIFFAAEPPGLNGLADKRFLVRRE